MGNSTVRKKLEIIYVKDGLALIGILQLGLKIAYYRKLRGLTQEQLAEQIDRTPAFIGHVEAPNIRKAVSLDTLFDIAKVLDVPAYKFLLFDD